MNQLEPGLTAPLSALWRNSAAPAREPVRVTKRHGTTPIAVAAAAVVALMVLTAADMGETARHVVTIVAHAVPIMPAFGG